MQQHQGTAEIIDETHDAEPIERWSTNFGKWVQAFGVRNLCDELNRRNFKCTDSAIYAWVRGTHQPKPRTATEIIRIADGEIGINDVYDHQRLLVDGEAALAPLVREEVAAATPPD